MTLKIHVCDAVMGSGKTQAAITMMNRETDRRFLFVTQFLDECRRIEEACPKRQFKQPKNVGKGKLISLNDLLRGQHNIASTHALFYKYNSETLDLIRSGHYTLILDEVIDVLEFIDVAASDVDILFEAGVISVDANTRRVVWVKDNYKGCFDGLRNKVESGCVTYENNRLVVWQLPLDVFEAFDEVIILTYMFSAQYQFYYYKMHNIDVDYIGVRHVDGLEYEFVPGLMREKITLPTIHLYANKKMNAIGEAKNALSVSWYNGQQSTGVEDLRRNLANFFTNISPSNSKLRLWSTYNDNRKSLQGNGYTRRFLAYNTRATNHQCL